MPIIGCEGCRRDPDDPANKEDASRPEIESSFLRVMPAHPDSPLNFAKPGHWAAAYQEYQANRQNFRGTLALEPRTPGAGPVAITGSDYGFQFARPAVLPKKQKKRFDVRFFLPKGPSRFTLRSQFQARQGVSFQAGDSLIKVMSPHQYYFVVLSSRNQQLQYLGDDDWQSMESSELSDTNQDLHYRVVSPAVKSDDSVIAIPDSFLQWTSVAYVLWDDISPDALTTDQQQAILDWVHWGGRIIINGPSAASEFRGTMLEPLLPIIPDDSAKVAGAELTELIEKWSVKGIRSDPNTRDETGVIEATKLAEADSIIGLGGEPKVDARAIENTGSMVYERLSGRGNVVITRFDLTSGWLSRWKSQSSFFNGALLRRPPRSYQRADFGHAIVFDEGLARDNRNPQLVTGLRVLSRDTSFTAANLKTAADVKPALGGSWKNRRFDGSPAGGLGSWNDQSGISATSQGALQDAAGITIPPANFVMKSLMWYLAILVPLNYIVFRLIGRLEWAWIAVPVVSIGGAIFVARSAQLDIGFARSRTEVALLELHDGYPRGHLTRYIALYNSLSTNYDIEFDSRESLVAPMAFGSAESGSPTRSIQYRHGFDSGIQATGLNVPSNKTELLHSEQMIALSGGVSLSPDGTQIQNDTGLELNDAFVIRRTENQELQVSPLGVLSTGENADLNFQSVSELKFGNDVPKAVANLMQFAVAPTHLRSGHVSLVARCNELPGMKIMPEAAQSKSDTVVHVSLRERFLPPAKPDSSLKPKTVFGEDFGPEFERRLIPQ